MLSPGRTGPITRGGRRYRPIKLTGEKKPMFNHGVGVVADGVADGRMLGLWYDPDRLIVEGVYCDEVTAYRARKRWIEALELHFLLEETLDFSLKVKLSRGGRHFKVRCDFKSACGRYAFWRLTHHQALEVQSLLETAHLPRPLCNVSTQEVMDDIDLLAELSQHHQSVGQSQEDSTPPGWQRAVRKVQDVAQRIADLTRRGDRNV